MAARSWCPALVLLSLLLLAPRAALGMCERVTANECKGAVPLPGVEKVGEGFDVVHMRGTGAWAVDTRSWQMPKGGCTLCHNEQVPGKRQRLPLAVHHWKSAVDCRRHLAGQTYDSADDVSAAQGQELDSSWSAHLDVQDKRGMAAAASAAGSHSRKADFARQRASSDRYSFSGLSFHCRLYQARLGHKPPVHPHLRKLLRTLPRTGSTKAAQFSYAQLLRIFGTHYVAGVDLGGAYTDLTALRTCQLSLNGQTLEEVKDCLEVETELKLSGKVDVNAGAKRQRCRQDRNKMEGKLTFHQTYSDRLTEVTGGSLSSMAHLFFPPSSDSLFFSSSNSSPSTSPPSSSSDESISPISSIVSTFLSSFLPSSPSPSNPPSNSNSSPSNSNPPSKGSLPSSNSQPSNSQPSNSLPSNSLPSNSDSIFSSNSKHSSISSDSLPSSNSLLPSNSQPSSNSLPSTDLFFTSDDYSDSISSSNSLPSSDSFFITSDDYSDSISPSNSLPPSSSSSSSPPSSAFAAWLSSVPLRPGVLHRRLEPLHLLLPEDDPRRALLRAAISRHILQAGAAAGRMNCSGARALSCPAGGQPDPRRPCSCRCQGQRLLDASCCPQQLRWGALRAKVRRGSGLWGDYMTHSDAFVRLRIGPAGLGGASASTAIVWNNNNPVWDSSLDLGEVSLGPGTQLTVEVWDRDNGHDDDLLGSCSVRLASGRHNHVCELHHGSVTYSLQLTCGPHLGGDQCQEYMPGP